MTKYFKTSFGKGGDRVAVPNETQPTGAVSYSTGYTVYYQDDITTDPRALSVDRQEFNGLLFDITSAIQYQQQHGFFDFITSDMNDGQPFPYAMASCVRYDMSDAKDGTKVRNYTSLINDNRGNPKDNPEDWEELGASTNSLGYTFTNITVDTTLTAGDAGVILIDASAGDLVVTLPSLSESTLFILKRIDNAGNKVKVQASGTGKIKYNLHINPNGYSFLHLFGAGDYWQLSNDGAGNWYDLNRIDNSPIGTTLFNISTTAPIGGYLVANGTLLSRAEYPYLWDYAQKSGALVAEANITGNEGCFTTGDGSTTFRVPDLRGEFIRSLDNGRGIDAGRVSGSSQGDAIRNITGDFITSSEKTPGVSASGAFEYEIIPAIETVTSKFVVREGIQYFFNAETVVPTASENRPRNIAYPLYIKII